MTEVRLYAHLPAASSLDSSEFQTEARSGLTVRDVLGKAGVGPGLVFIVMADNDRAGLEAVLADGDRLGLFPVVGGG